MVGNWNEREERLLWLLRLFRNNICLQRGKVKLFFSFVVWNFFNIRQTFKNLPHANRIEKRWALHHVLHFMVLGDSHRSVFFFSLSFLKCCHWPVSLWPDVNFSVIVPFTILSVLSFQIYNTISKLRHRLQHRQGSVWKVGPTFPNYSRTISSLNGAANGGQGRVFRRQETVQQSESKEHNLAVILIFTTVTFLILHTPR